MPVKKFTTCSRYWLFITVLYIWMNFRVNWQDIKSDVTKGSDRRRTRKYPTIGSPLQRSPSHHSMPVCDQGSPSSTLRAGWWTWRPPLGSEAPFSNSTSKSNNQIFIKGIVLTNFWSTDSIKLLLKYFDCEIVSHEMAPLWKLSCRSRVSLFYSLKSLSLDGVVFFWPRANVLSKKLPIAQWQKVNSWMFFWQNRGLFISFKSKRGQNLPAPTSVLKINYFVAAEVWIWPETYSLKQKMLHLFVWKGKEVKFSIQIWYK